MRRTPLRGMGLEATYEYIDMYGTLETKES
jgi:hypothetical protein